MASTVLGYILYDLRRENYTVGRVRLDDLDIDTPDDGQYHDYEPINAKAALPPYAVSAFPQQGAVVDVGCGRGRMRIIAVGDVRLDVSGPGRHVRAAAGPEGARRPAASTS
jgi:hypothetical protein